jgi:Nitronate monooxygenase
MKWTGFSAPTAHAGGALAGWQVGSVAEAVAAAAAGCDYLVAQGIEAGGHVRGTQALDEILAQVVDAVRIPVLAAGGVATAERVVGLLRSGADGVRIGTRFLACPESGAHQEYVDSLLAATAGDTVLSEWFSEDWENAPHRVLRACEAAARQSGWRSTAPPGGAWAARRPRTWRCTPAWELARCEPCSRRPRLSPTSSRYWPKRIARPWPRAAQFVPGLARAAGRPVHCPLTCANPVDH